MMITHLISPAKAIRVVLFLTTIAATAVVGSTTRNIVRKNEVASSSSFSSSSVVGDSSSQQHRSLIVGLNEMDCKESVETNDGSIVCTFRIMPPTTADTTTSSSSTSPNTLIHDCLMGAGGSNFCITAEVYPSDQANQMNQQEAVAANNPPPLPPPTPTTTKQQQQQQQDCPTYKPQSGSQCGGWIPTGANERNCMYGDNRCDCDGYGRSEASSIIWICDNDLFVAPPMSIVNIDATLSSAIVPPAAPAEPVIPSHSNRIQIPTPVNGPNCPSYMPSNGSACNWVLTNKFSSYQCGYLSGDEVPQLPGTFMMVCKCDSTDTFVCAPAPEEIYHGVQSSSF